MRALVKIATDLNRKLQHLPKPNSILLQLETFKAQFGPQIFGSVRTEFSSIFGCGRTTTELTSHDRIKTRSF